MRKIFCRSGVMFAAVIAVALLSGVSVRGEEDTSPVSMTIEEVDARIQSLEVSMIQIEGERIRQKHDAAYADTDLGQERLEVKKLEGRMNGIRQDYAMRLRVLDETIRKQESEISKRFDEIVDFENLEKAIAREIKFAEETGDGSNSEMIALLRLEQADLAAQIGEAREKIEQTNEELLERKMTITEGDKEAGALFAQLRKVEGEFAERTARLHEKLNETPDIRELDAKRRELMIDLQKMRDLKKELQQGALNQ